MVKYLCDICGKEMEDRHYFLVKIPSRFNTEDNVIRIKDNCGYQDIDCCKECENKISKAISHALGLTEAFN